MRVFLSRCSGLEFWAFLMCICNLQFILSTRVCVRETSVGDIASICMHACMQPSVIPPLAQGTTARSIHSAPSRLHRVLRFGTTPSSSSSSRTGSNTSNVKFSNAQATHSFSSGVFSFPRSGSVSGHPAASLVSLKRLPGVGRTKDARRKGGRLLNVLIRRDSQSLLVLGAPAPTLESVVLSVLENMVRGK